MFLQLKKAFRQTAIYSLGNISTKIVGFILLPLYTDFLTTGEYGILAILQAIMQILIGVFGFNLHTAMMRWYAVEKDERAKESIVFTTLSVTITIAIILCFSIFPFSKRLSIEIFQTPNYDLYFKILFLSVTVGIVNNVPLNLIRLKELPIFYTILTTTKFLVIVLLNIYFVAYAKIGVEGILISELVGHTLVIIATIPIVVKNSNILFNYKIFLEMLKYGIPLIFSTVFTFILTLSDRFIIKYISGEASVGVYSLGHKLASVINMLILQSFQLGFLPIAYKKIGKPDEQRFLAKILTYYTLLLTVVALSLSLVGKEIITIFASNNDYWIAYTVVPIISLAFVLKGIQYNFALSFHYAKQTKYNAYIVIVVAILNIILNYYFVTFWGFIGSAYAMVISVTVMLILSYLLGRKVYPIKFEIVKIIKVLIVGVSLFIVINSIQISSKWIAMFVKLTAMQIIWPILYFLNIFEDVEKKKMKEIFSKLF